MSEHRIAERYAKSVIGLAEEQNQLDTISSDFASLKEAFKNRDLYNLMKSPIVYGGQKLRIFNLIFGDSLSTLTKAFIQRVIKKGREDIIPEMIEEFVIQYNKKKGITQVKLTTAKALTEEALTKIKKAIANVIGESGNVDLEISVNPDLIGGFVVDLDDQVYDASIRHKLENLKKSFS
jgi:F-type H+-transporting ATPase subunit delta